MLSHRTAKFQSSSLAARSPPQNVYKCFSATDRAVERNLSQRSQRLTLYKYKQTVEGKIDKRDREEQRRAGRFLLRRLARMLCVIKDKAKRDKRGFAHRVFITRVEKTGFFCEN